MPIPVYPDFVSVELELRNEIHPLLSRTVDGVSEFTFSNLFLFRKRYQYRITLLPDGNPIISGITPGSTSAFFMSPCGYPGSDVLADLFKTHDYWKNIPPSLLELSVDGVSFRRQIEKMGITISEDRNNFDYLYLKSDLAKLPGRKYHKKKNLVNAFIKNWPDHEERPLEAALIPDALAVLEGWRNDKGDEIDFCAARNALEHFSELELTGALYYVDKKPVAYCLGETICRGAMFAVHFEKALETYKGVFQFMNQAFAASLPDGISLINREQDLGDKGLRQAKMTYRPIGFVRKFRGWSGV